MVPRADYAGCMEDAQGLEPHRRQSLVHEPGVRLRHPAQSQDPLLPGPFGARTVSQPDESVGAFISTLPDGQMARWKLEQAEAVYARWDTAYHRQPQTRNPKPHHWGQAAS